MVFARLLRVPLARLGINTLGLSLPPRGNPERQVERTEAYEACEDESSRHYEQDDGCCT